MIKVIKSCELQGINGTLVHVEVHVSRGQPKFDIIGLPDTAIKESVLRIFTALKNSDIRFPALKHIVINLAPAEMQKEGPSYDMAFITGILAAEFESDIDFDKSMFVGELSLNGQFRHVRGILSIVDFAKSIGCKKIFVPLVDVNEALMIEGIDVYGVKDLNALFDHINGVHLKKSLSQEVYVKKTLEFMSDFKFISGQNHAKRAMEIAAAGMHNILLSGPPGSGKTMLAQSLPSILPEMSHEEMIDVAKIYSVSLNTHSIQLKKVRPFRSPHHSASAVSLIGGGRIPRPGEISLAHRGVLFLDEFPEFSKLSLETLRQPLEDGVVTIARAAQTISYPAKFMLVAAQNPCPCGFYSDPQIRCTCSANQISKYKSKISGPLLDRIDLQISVPRISASELEKSELGESSEAISKRVLNVRDIQMKRFKESGIYFNSEMKQRDIQKFCLLEDSAKKILQHATEKYRLSTRSYFRIQRVARTIADLEGEDIILLRHIAEALEYRFN